jgi:hypothetical protein
MSARQKKNIMAEKLCMYTYWLLEYALIDL